MTKLTALRLDAAKEQAVVVGSDIIAFVRGVSADQRGDIVNASLLAHLAANRKFANPETLGDVNAWYDAYFEVLSNIGFAVERGFSGYQEKGPDFEAHKAILIVAATLPVGSPEALRLVQRWLEALQSLSANSPWNLLFNRASQAGNTSRFQMTLVDQDEKNQLRVCMMAFGLESKVRPRQVLFFKFQSDQVTVQHHSGRLTVSAGLLASLREPIALKVGPYMDQYIRQLPDL